VTGIRTARAGQSLIESCFVVAVICLIFFGLFQISQLFAAKAILTYAAAAGARARTVGFNDFMVYKVVRAAAIPNAGRMTTPPYDPSGTAGGAWWGAARPGEAWDRASTPGVPASAQYEIERSRIPDYLGTTRWSQLEGILDYERWDEIRFGEAPATEDFVEFNASQRYPLVYPFARAYYAADTVRLASGEPHVNENIQRERHAPLYLDVPTSIATP
jgi:hypothetical protein